eukprot:TRINITY_DN10199_c0_g1_i4.p1 TRINITY_DN10199_c0_g1~~TRINITY_DN10199_c0_g1_i4.p1  ORF type:complete len:126 (-),score=6.30 TRINITY_DN10199_c0_g1_i4:5-382(-)
MFKHNPEIVRMLLENGANPNIADNDGFTPLHVAPLEDDIVAVEYLLKYNASTNIHNNKLGMTPLHFACYFSSYEIVEILVKVTDLQLKDFSGNTGRDACCKECATASWSDKIFCEEKCQILKQYN